MRTDKVVDELGPRFQCLSDGLEFCSAPNLLSFLQNILDIVLANLTSSCLPELAMGLFYPGFFCLGCLS